MKWRNQKDWKSKKQKTESKSEERFETPSMLEYRKLRREKYRDKSKLRVNDYLNRLNKDEWDD